MTHRPSLILAVLLSCVMGLIGTLRVSAQQSPESDPVIIEKKRPSTPATRSSSKVRKGAEILRPADHGVGRLIPDVSFADLEGTKHTLSEFRTRPLTVIAMTSTSCPLSRKFLPTLNELARAYSAKNVQFVVINGVPTDRQKEMQAAAARFADSAIYVHDAEESLSRHFGMLTTTDVIVLDAARTVVYHGAIDDQYGLGYALDAPRKRFLADALEALLAGKQPTVLATKAPGCTVEQDQDAQRGESALTWHNRISRILQAHCIECHRAGGVGPFPLDSYSDVIGHASMIRQVVEQKSMPPWFAADSNEEHPSVWANDRSLTASDRGDLLAWLDSERLEGNPADAPLSPQFAEGWTIGKPDLVVQIPEPIQVKASGTMPYQFVTTQTTLKEDKWVQAYEIIPTDRSVVHHVLVNVHETGEERVRDREEGVGGYWAAYVPGNSSQVYPPGFARKLPAGATVSFQIHYTPSGTETHDQLKMGLVFAAEPEYVVTTIPLADTDLNIAPHTADHVESITRPVPKDVNVMAYMAHMHVRGKSFKFELTKPDGSTETLLDIPQYDFNWQLRYEYLQPRVIPAGSRIKVTAVFDNSEGNPANPDPTQTVHWGQQTYEEMLIGYIETYSPLGESRPTLRSVEQNGPALFRLVDTNVDGKISRDEATKAAERIPRLRDNPEVMDRVFSKSDSDNDKLLDEDEFGRLREQLGARR